MLRPIVVLVLFMSVGCGQRLEPPAPDPDPPTRGNSILVSAEADLEEISPAGVRRFEIVGDGETVFVHYAGGDQRCYGLSHVDVEYLKSAIVIAVFEGSRPGASACPDQGVFKVTRVSLDEPVGNRRIVDALTRS